MNYIIRDAVFEDYAGISVLISQVHNLHYQNRPDIYLDTKIPLPKIDFQDR